MDINGRTIRREESMPIDPAARRAVEASNLRGSLKGLESDVRRLTSSSPAAVLPGSPVDGQVCYYQTAAMAALGVVWTLKYRAASASAYKWESIGGSAFGTEYTGGNSITSATVNAFTDFTNPTTVVLPLAGDYEVSHVALVQNNVAANSSGIGVFTAANVAVSATAVMASSGPNLYDTTQLGRVERINGLAATTYKTRAYNSVTTAGATYWDRRNLYFKPIRVG